MANVLVDGGFQGGFDSSRQASLGTSEDDSITLPAPLFGTDGQLITPTANGATLEILLLDGDDNLQPDLVVFPDNSQLVVNGNTGNDLIIGGPESDTLFGGQGDDDLQGGDEVDQIFGNLGNDIRLDGSAGDDSVFGGQGNDDVRGGDGNDAVFGDLGNDLVTGNAGIDTLTGGSGVDVFSIDPTIEFATFDPAFADRILDFSTSTDQGADQIDIVGLVVPPVIGTDIEIGNLQNVGGVNGFAVFDLMDLNGNGLIGEVLTFVVDNPNITRPLDATDFI
ncbi:MAG: calcium-binding protein [Microcoleaceae cyanobacterium]